MLMIERVLHDEQQENVERVCKRSSKTKCKESATCSKSSIASSISMMTDTVSSASDFFSNSPRKSCELMLKVFRVLSILPSKSLDLHCMCKGARVRFQRSLQETPVHKCSQEMPLSANFFSPFQTHPFGWFVSFCTDEDKLQRNGLISNGENSMEPKACA